MKTLGFLLLVLTCGIVGAVGYAEPPIDPITEAFIDKLPETAEMGFGYSTLFAGSQFLPQPDSDHVYTCVLGYPAPEKSTVLEAIVRRGSLAVPVLLKHLDDARPTKIPPLERKGVMQWMSYENEHDVNRHTMPLPPLLPYDPIELIFSRCGGPAPQKKIRKLIGTDKINQKPNSTHTITVGDLCFVALGQIVNRDFIATRYQPTAGLIVTSPTHSKLLCTDVREEYQDWDEQKHREQLSQDFLRPDYYDRRIGAYRRLAFYYPDALPPLVQKLLAIPTYDGQKIERFVREELYTKGKLFTQETEAQRKVLFDKFIQNNGPTAADGILLQLFADLSNYHYEASRLLAMLYGYGPEVSRENWPYVDTWSSAERADCIRELAKLEGAKGTTTKPTNAPNSTPGREVQ